MDKRITRWSVYSLEPHVRSGSGKYLPYLYEQDSTLDEAIQWLLNYYWEDECPGFVIFDASGMPCVLLLTRGSFDTSDGIVEVRTLQNSVSTKFRGFYRVVYVRDSEDRLVSLVLRVAPEDVEELLKYADKKYRTYRKDLPDAVSTTTE